MPIFLDDTEKNSKLILVIGQRDCKNQEKTIRDWK